MKELEYPFDSEYILQKKKSIKRELLDSKKNFIEKKIAILGGSTTNDIKLVLELFLLNYGIKAEFYESEYNKYYEDALFGNEELDKFKPDIIYIHTTNRNINYYPSVRDSEEEVNNKLNNEYNRFVSIWESLSNKYNAIIIQNNFDYLYYRLLGNKDSVDYRGKNNYITRLNMLFNEYVNKHNNIYINDINYVSSCYGLDKWANEFYWYMYKYALDIQAIPSLAFNIANIIKAIYGKNKKAFVLDLDNTLWGGVIGDDGVDAIHVGPETSNDQVYYEFQQYIKDHKDLGVILNIASKNYYDVAMEGLKRPGSVLKLEDFIISKINWEPKHENIKTMGQELNLGCDSFVFLDDNPAERKIVSDYVEGISAPELDRAENYIRIIDKNGYFECISLSDEDRNKDKMYRDNAKRSEMMATFSNYDDYLKSLKMKAEIKSFKPIYLERITQLTNKSNQFNLTTKRYSEIDIKNIYEDNNYIKLYGKLEDIFGDNGVISIVIGNVKEKELHIDLWVMSCRVLKRKMEYAMMDELVKRCKKNKIEKIYGYYYPTVKNKLVLNFYDDMGFNLDNEDENGNKTYSLLVKDYKKQCKVIKVDNKE